STPSSCSSVSGSVSTISLSTIWVEVTNSGVTTYYDPSFKNYTRIPGMNTSTAPVALSTALGCGPYSAPTCGSSALSVALPSGTTGYDSLAHANYAQNVAYTSLGSKLNSFAKNLQSYIETYMPTAQVVDIVGGKKIN